MNNQMNSAVRKIHNLLSSGAVTVTGPNQPRILKQKVGTSSSVTSTNNLQQVQASGNRCYICDDALSVSQAQHQLTEMQTQHTATKFPNKIGQLVGDAFMVIVSVEDVVCSRCTNLINYLDRLENDVERVRTNLMNLLHKKYGLNDEGGGGGTSSPPIKMQKLNSGGTATRNADDVGEINRTRKLLHTPTVNDSSSLGKQSPPVSAVQQIKISPHPVAQQHTQTLQRKTTRIYKCLSCDYKTSDMRLFNTHYETCKQQNFQCKNCKKIFPNFGAMKQHMVREHNTPMDNTCAVCHLNFVNEGALRKHMELNHSTNVVVTSTTTIPAGVTVSPAAVAAAAADPIGVGGGGSVTSSNNATTTTSLYTCNHCQFKSTDKALFDEHLRKHLTGAKPKPFKCRLCAQRFETREAATIHAKQHQPNYFKCGTCSMSFSKRELLVKHFEVHQQQQQQQQQQPQIQQQAINTVSAQQQPTTVTVKQIQQQHTTSNQSSITTQKLLQETIDEAVSDSNVPVTAAQNVAADVGGSTAAAVANNIRFFTCQVCSVTFIQENYYNQHMETHRREKKQAGVGASATAAASDGNASGGGSLSKLNSAAAAILGDSLSKGDSETTSAHQQSNTAEADIESIFEKMHSDKGDANSMDAVSTTATSLAGTNTTSTTASGGVQSTAGDNLVITSQEGSGGITFNITIPQPDAAAAADGQQESQKARNPPTSTAPVSVSIDMPMLDQPDESALSSIASAAEEHNNKNVDKTIANLKSDTNSASTTITQHKSASTSSGPVSMPSLDDDNDTQESAQSVGAKSKKNKGSDDDDKTEGEEKSSGEAEENAAENSAEASNGNNGEGSEHHQISAAASETENSTSDHHLQADAAGGEEQVTMELDEAMQAQVEGGQIKFILNENGHLLQLDNHIITDAEGNQILVQDPEQIQQLLQSVGVLQSGDALDGETLQMMTDANGQMVLVHGENNETQLIDASLLNADGQLVIQQGQDGELGEGAHVIGEDGTRIPVSVSYTADGQPIVQVQQQVMEESAAGEGGEHAVLDKDGVAAVSAADEGDEQQHAAAEASEESADGTSGGGGGGSGGNFFALEELMQQSSDAKAAE